MGPQRAGAHRPFDPLLFPFEPEPFPLSARGRLILVPRLFQAPHHIASAARPVFSSASAWDRRTGGTDSAVERHRSLQTSSSRGRCARTAYRCASAASSAPCAVACARSSDAPRVNRCSSSTSSPRRHAVSRCRGLPAASARSASPSQPLARDSAVPRRRLRAAATK